MKSLQSTDKKCGRLLSAALLICNITDGEAAKLMDVTKETVRHWKSGYCVYNVQMLLNLQTQIFDKAGWDWIGFFLDNIQEVDR